MIFFVGNLQCLSGKATFCPPTFSNPPRRCRDIVIVHDCDVCVLTVDCWSDAFKILSLWRPWHTVYATPDVRVAYRRSTNSRVHWLHGEMQQHLRTTTNWRLQTSLMTDSSTRIVSLPSDAAVTWLGCYRSEIDGNVFIRTRDACITTMAIATAAAAVAADQRVTSRPLLS